MAIDASGEPPLPQLLRWYRDSDTQAAPSSEFWDLCRRRDEYRTAYNEYWTSTQGKSAYERPVDGVILPVAPSAATEEGLFSYYGTCGIGASVYNISTDSEVIAYSGIVNVLDYTSGSFPVTFADRSVDFETPTYKPMNLTDRSVWRMCKTSCSACMILADTVCFYVRSEGFFRWSSRWTSSHGKMTTGRESDRVNGSHYCGITRLYWWQQSSSMRAVISLILPAIGLYS